MTVIAGVVEFRLTIGWPVSRASIFGRIDVQVG